jgi:hypothetical protein
MRMGRMALTGLLALYGVAIWRSDESFTLLDNVNLPIHETGHLVFAPFGEQLTILGGTIFQFLVPLTFLVSFLMRADRHAASIMLWWVGENCIYSSWYMADAIVQELPLVGGGEHDWAALFEMWNVLGQAEHIGHDVRVVGGVVMALAVVWGAFEALRAVAAPSASWERAEPASSSGRIAR